MGNASISEIKCVKKYGYICMQTEDNQNNIQRFLLFREDGKSFELKDIAELPYTMTEQIMQKQSQDRDVEEDTFKYLRYELAEDKKSVEITIQNRKFDKSKNPLILARRIEKF